MIIRDYAAKRKRKSQNLQKEMIDLAAPSGDFLPKQLSGPNNFETPKGPKH